MLNHYQVSQMSVKVKDRIAQMYEHASHYVRIASRLGPEGQKKLKSYAASCSTSIVAEGLLATLSFEASKAKEKAIREVIKARNSEAISTLEEIKEEELAHALVYDCVASWILPLVGVKEELYQEKPLEILLRLAERYNDLALKSRTLHEACLLLEALKRLAEGEFG